MWEKEVAHGHIELGRVPEYTLQLQKEKVRHDCMTNRDSIIHTWDHDRSQTDRDRIPIVLLLYLA